ncbi:hypothetical protein HDU76_010181, partial [Blyttiomyces sp. JEL0837]
MNPIRASSTHHSTAPHHQHQQPAHLAVPVSYHEQEQHLIEEEEEEEKRYAFEEEKLVWFQWEGSVLPATIPYIVGFTIYATILTIANKVFGAPIIMEDKLIPVLTIVLDDRFWEGRKLWSTLCSNIRTAARLINTSFPSTTPLEKAQKVAALRLLVAYAVAVKHHLRGEHGPEFDDYDSALVAVPSISIAGLASPTSPLSRKGPVAVTRTTVTAATTTTTTAAAASGSVPNGAVDAEGSPLLKRNTTLKRSLTKNLPQFLIAEESSHSFDYSCGCSNIPLAIAQNLTTVIVTKVNKNQIPALVGNGLLASMTGMVDCLTNLDRILTTKIPMAYAIHLKQILTLYTIMLPFQILKYLGWFTIPTMAIAVFTLFGIENIGLEIENPFGYDAN